MTNSMTSPDKTPLDVLRKARELISTPERWTKGASARTAKGYPIGAKCAPAVCWCTLGAIWHEDYPSEPWIEGAENALVASLGHDAVADWNDAPERTHAEVLDLFDKTISRLESEASQ